MRLGLIIWLFVTSAYAQSVYDVYSMQTASADLCRSQGRFMFSNPATIADLKVASVSISEVIPYSIPNLKINLISTAFIIKEKGFSIDYSYSGFSDYTNQLLSICTGIKLNPKNSFGIKIITQQQHVFNANHQYNINAEIGMIEHFNRKTSSAIQLKLNSFKSDNQKDRSSIKLGLNHRPVPSLMCMVNVELNDSGEFFARSSLEYNIDSILDIRMGWTSNESNFCGGLSYQIKKVGIDCGMAFHKNLGFSYAAGLCYSFNK